MTVTVKPSARLPRSPKGLPRHAAPPARSRIGGWLAVLALLALLVPLHNWWPVQVLMVPMLLIVPGVLLLRALRIPGRAVSSFPVYVPCASIVVLFASGLAVDILGPLIGVAVPLRAGPVLVSLEVICLGLLAASVNAPPETRIPWRNLSRPAGLAWPLVIPLLAAAGALRLNAGHGSGIAFAALSACLVLLVTALMISKRLDKSLLIVILYAAGLTVMWAFSLRGNLVYGFDISTEYHDLQQAVTTGIWHTAHPGDAYGAMLSVTVMPAELHFLSGVPPLLIFKVVYPAICALFPVAVFGIARRVLPRRWAFAAAVFIVMQVTFAQEVPGLARQEIALVLFAGVIMAMLDTRLPRRPQWSMTALLSLALVLSHYSTTYVAILLIGLPLGLQWAVSWFRDIPRVTGAIAVAFVAALAGAILWYGPVTGSGSGVGNFVHAVRTQGLDVLPSRASGQGLLAAYLQGGTQTPMSATTYESQTAHFYRFRVTPLPAAFSPEYALRNSPVPTPAVKSPVAAGALSLGLLVVEQLANVLGAIGALLMVLRRRVSIVTRQVGLLGVATLIFLVMIRLSSTLAAAYNQERALVQALAVLSIAMGWSLQRLAGKGRRRQAGVLAIAASALAVLFISSSGLVGGMLGGGTAVNLASSGEDYERFFMTTPELASASWLGRTARPHQLVYADRYAELRLFAMTNLNRARMISDVTPKSVHQHAWVYASRTNVMDKRARALYNNHLVIYVFPAAYLSENYDLVYTDGSSEVFHR